MRIRTALTLSAAILLTLTSSPASASGHIEHDHANDPEPSSRSWVCTESTSTGHACFAPQGEWFFAYDKRVDGWSPVIKWRSRTKSGTVLREGRIWHTKGAYRYAYKNKSFDEGREVVFRLCPGTHTSSGHFIDHDRCSFPWMSET
ncbi:hypothetical protein [Streptomyces gobiensis]|uniref:hypothetical protein n=1 Tax=Streptomyces gobiensis TaxID=2875706 RepID=UPI001E5ACA3C|nr:hypothetical protein [Streptomyces gobiensis]UGY95321.1 hypothetical protein test1122_05475 [Streptomyces gobiensis]